MFCRKCGNLIPDDSDFCYKCGTAVEREEETAINSQLWVYNNAIKAFDDAQTIEELEKAESTFKKLGDYKNSAEYAEKCRGKKFPLLYDSTVSLLKSAKSTEEFQSAEKNLEYLGNYKNCEQLLERCRYDLKLSKYNDAYKRSKTAKTVDDFLEAEKMFRELGDFEDAVHLADGCAESSKEKRYLAADEALKKSESTDSLTEAAKEFEALGSYKDAASKADKARKSTALLDKYNEAREKMQAAFTTNPNSGTLFYEAESMFSALGSFKDSSVLAQTCIYNANVIRYNMAFEKLINVATVEDAEKCRAEFAALGDFYMSQKMVSECDKVIHNFSVLDELKKLRTPLECSNDIDTLQSARRKALSLDGAGNSAQLVKEFDRKIECIKSNRPFRLAKLKPELTANVDFSSRAVFKTELDSDELTQAIKPAEANYSKQQASAQSSTVNLDKQPQSSSVNLEKQSQSSAPSSTNAQNSERNAAPIAQDQQCCTFCHSKIPLNVTECPNCGVNIKKYEPISVGHKYCRFCGCEIDNDTKVCPHCGTTINGYVPAENKINNKSSKNDEDGFKTFAGCLSGIYYLVVFIAIIYFFTTGQCNFTDKLFEIEYFIPAGQTFAGIVLGGAAVIGILCLIYKLAHKK